MSKPKHSRYKVQLELELLESRDLLSQSYPGYVLLPQGGGSSPLGGSATPQGVTPAQMRQAYGFNQITFNNGTVDGTGAGTTIAIVDAFDDPSIAGDLQNFDAEFGLPNPSFTKVNQSGGSTLPQSNGSWAGEIALDVEWAHAIAPSASILLVECNGDDNTDLFAGVAFAAKQPDVVVVSMSFAGREYSGETQSDSTFTTPANHAGVTFVAGSGDTGAPPNYPAMSPNVLAVGGTVLTVDSAGNNLGESGWSGSGGGISAYESQPAYQSSVVTQSSTMRTNPDVAYASLITNSGYPVYDTFNNPPSSPWSLTGGTSAATPQWAALIAIADQGRALDGLSSLDGPSQVLPLLYYTPAANFHAITTGGSTGTPAYSATAGYNLVTGRGSPLANNIVAELIGMNVNSTTPAIGSTVLAPPTSFVLNFSEVFNPTKVLASYFTVNGVPANNVSLNASDTTATFTFNTSPVTSQGVQTMSIASGLIAELHVPTLKNVAFTGTFTYTAPAATMFKVSTTGSSFAAGTPINLTVAAFDNSNDPAIGYTGTVHFSTTDPGLGVILPPDYSFVPSDNGVHVFSAGVTLVTTGIQTVTVVDTVTSSIAGTLNLTVSAGAATHFGITAAPSVIQAGTPFGIVVSALDAFGNIATSYLGTVHFSSSDPQASFQGDSTLTNGIGVFGVLLKTAGSQTLTATDTVTSGISGMSNLIQVNGLGIDSFAVLAPPSAITGNAVVFTVIAEDSFGNTVTGYSGTVHFASSDPAADLPHDSTLTNGIGVFSATLNTPGNDTLTASDTLTTSISGVSSTIVTRGLIVTSFTPTPSGFQVVFNKPVDASEVSLYASSGVLGVDDVLLAGPGMPPTSFHGSLIFDATDTTATFVKTSTFSASSTFNPSTGVLAAGTYTVTIRSAANGFTDMAGGLLDGLDNGNPAGSNYVATFVVSTPPVVVGIPSFRGGPATW